MRIAVVSYHEQGAGTPLASLWFSARECRSRGIELTFFHTRRPPGLDELRRADRVLFDGINTLRHQWGPAYYAAARALRRPFGIYYHETGWNLRSATSWTPTFHGPLPLPLAVRHAMTSRRAVHFHVCAPGIELLTSGYGVDPTRTRLLNNITAAQPLLRHSLPLEGEAGLSVIVGQASQRKGTDVLLDVMERVIPENPSRRFLWVGGFAGGRFSKEALESELTQRGLSEHLQFMGYRNDAIGVMARAQNVLLVSRDDPMPKVLMEALALGKHSIAFDVGGVRDLLGPYGTVVPAGDVGAFARALLDGNPDPSADVQHARRQWFTDRFTEQAFARRFEESVDWWSRLERLRAA